MSDSTKTAPINDLLAKQQKPNHLATLIEKQAAAGAALPKHLSSKYQFLMAHTQLVRQALAELFTEALLNDCYVVHVSPVEITLSMGSATAANHARYVMENCVQALRAYDQRFCQLQSIKVILSPNLLQSETRPDATKKTLSENTRQIIAKNAEFVTQNARLKQALARLSDSSSKNDE